MGVFENIYTGKVQAEYKKVMSAIGKAEGIVGDRFYNAIVNTFSWGNLPKTILPMLPEQNLFFWGMQAFFQDDDGEFKIYPCYMGGELLENGEYSHYNIIARNGKTWLKKKEEIEICYNNNLRLPSVGICSEFVEKSTFALLAVDASLERAIIPAIIECENESQLTAITDLYDRAKNLQPFRPTLVDGFSKREISIKQLFDNRTNDILALWDVWTRYKNDFYLYNGFQNVEIQKTERLTQQESQGNEEMVRYTILKDKYDCRRDFVERVKNHFDYSLELSLNRDERAVWAITATNEEKRERYMQGTISTSMAYDDKTIGIKDVREEIENEASD